MTHSKATADLLDDISQMILHSDFDEAAEVAGKAADAIAI
jgi:hypothetical protein